jgi:hypothetical protein
MVVSGTLIFLVSALRSSTIGTDTPTYVAFYDQIIGELPELPPLAKPFKGYEPGFILYVVFVRLVFGSNSQWLLVTTSLIVTFSICYLFYKNSPAPFLSLIIYILFMCWFDQMNVMRTALACSIVFIGFDQLKQKRYFRFILSVIFASCFHRAALIFILLIPLRFIKVTKKNLYIFGGVGALLSALCRPFFFLLVKFLPNYSGYLEKFSGTNFFGAVFMLAVPLTIIFSFLMVFSRVHPKFPKTEVFPLSPDFSFLFKILCLFAFFTSLTMSVTIMLRVASLFSFVVPLFVPYLLDFILKNKNEYYKFFCSAIFVGFAAYFVIVVAFRPEWTSCVPYSFFWNNSSLSSVSSNGSPQSAGMRLLVNKASLVSLAHNAFGKAQSTFTN